MLGPLVIPEVILGPVHPDIGPLHVQLLLDGLQCVRVKGKGVVAVERAFSVAGLRPDAVHGPSTPDLVV